MSPAEPSRRPRARRFWRWSAGVALALALLAGALILLRIPIARPFDVVVNLGPAVVAPELAAPPDGAHRLVVLVHGMFRTSSSLGRLGRTLAAHGYEVLPFDYPSNAARIEEHAARLAAAIEARWAERPVDELRFVAHSMGGLVVHEYLRGPTARRPVAGVFLAVPHRGAVLADLRKHWFLFRWAMGTQAALQLSPGDALHSVPLPQGFPRGVVVGDLGPGNPSIPGADDGTVAVGEARLEGATDTVVVPVGHTRITFDARVLREVLHFFRHGHFAAGEVASGGVPR